MDCMEPSMKRLLVSSILKKSMALAVAQVVGIIDIYSVSAGKPYFLEAY